MMKIVRGVTLTNILCRNNICMFIRMFDYNQRQTMKHRYRTGDHECRPDTFK